MRTPASGSERELRFQEVIASYLEGLEGGRAEDLPALLQRHPDLAEEIAAFFDNQERIARLLPPRTGTTAAGEGSAPPDLGDFRIVREVGRGGMGIVYEAQQISLRRRVALKVLPFAATMDPRHLQRFHNEAQAAACLHHTNIVPVFSVGCERGVHFYAMQFIDGLPLSDLIRQLRGREKTATMPAGEEQTAAYQPSPGNTATPPPAAEMTPLTGEGKRGRDYYRKVAELGVQAAEALDHAHQLGIVHRDIKPANLLVDGRGNLWVADFGLAHIQHSEASLTTTGQAVGTPRYMSPEQALVKREPIDNRTDVYSLGATLYELLTLRPAFWTEDRQELMRQIAFEEPIRPRRLERAIPAELEIIVLKAMEKRPQDRYATAQELADDLRRWLDDQPIRARRPGIVQRAAKWGRRHRPLVVAAVLCLFLALVMLAISNVVIWHEHEETKEALLKARIHEQEVSSLVDRERQFREEFEVKLQRSLEAMDSILTRLDEPTPGEGPLPARMRQDVSEQARKFYLDLLPIESHRPSLLCEMMWAYVRLGNLSAWRNQFADALTAYNKHGEILNRLVVPGVPSSEHALPVMLSAGGTHERPAVERAYRRALAHWRKTSPNGLVQVQDFRISQFYKDQELRQRAEPNAPNNLRMDIRLYDGSVVHASRADWDNRPKEISIYERVVEDLPTPNHAYRLLHLEHQYGQYLQTTGRIEDAKAVYRQAVKHAEKVVAHFPVSKEDRNLAWAQRANQLASLLLQLGYHLYDLSVPADAESAFRIGLGLFEEGHRTDPHNKSNNRQSRAFYLNNLGRFLVKKGQFRQGAEIFRRADQLGSINPSWSDYFAEMVRNCERLVELDGKLPAILSGQQQPADTTERLDLAQLCHLPCKKRYADAVRFYCDAFAAEPKLADDLNAQHRYNAACAAALAGCGQSKDADKLDDKERARLRQQALDWLCADLKAYRQVMEKSADRDAPAIAQRMQHWLQDDDFAGVRGEDDLRKLPEAERPPWQKLWQDVEALRQEAAAKTKPPTAVDQPNGKEGSPGKD